MLKSAFRLLVAVSLATPIAIGCQKQGQVTRYTVPREPSDTPPRTVKAEPGPRPAEATEGRGERLLAAMIRRDGRVWFFKLVGPSELVSGQTGAFRTFVESVRFAGAGGNPEWTLPDGWHQQAASGMRHATIAIDSPGKPLELTVIPLKPTDGDFNDYVLTNVDRWRQQLGLPPTSKVRLFGPGERSGDLVALDLGGGESALLVDLAGDAGSNVASVLAGSASSPPMGRALTLPVKPGPLGGSPLTYEAPAGWSPGRVDAMRQAAFEVRDGSKSAEVTVIALSASGGDLLANVNRWREQVHLSPIGRDELDRQAKEFPVGGEKGRYVELAGPAGTQPRESILGVICTHGDQAWFFKMKGDADLVAQERGRFESFVHSARFDGGTGANNGK